MMYTTITFKTKNTIHSDFEIHLHDPLAVLVKVEVTWPPAPGHMQNFGVHLSGREDFEALNMQRHTI